MRKHTIYVSNKYGDDEKQKILLGCVYRSGTPTTAAKYDDNLNRMLISMTALPNYIQKYCVGDFNDNKIQ